jgi:hypothetical protein
LCRWLAAPPHCWKLVPLVSLVSQLCLVLQQDLSMILGHQPHAAWGLHGCSDWWGAAPTPLGSCSGRGGWVPPLQVAKWPGSRFSPGTPCWDTTWRPLGGCMDVTTWRLPLAWVLAVGLTWAFGLHSPSVTSRAASRPPHCLAHTPLEMETCPNSPNTELQHQVPLTDQGMSSPMPPWLQLTPPSQPKPCCMHAYGGQLATLTWHIPQPATPPGRGPNSNADFHDPGTWDWPPSKTNLTSFGPQAKN